MGVTWNVRVYALTILVLFVANSINGCSDTNQSDHVSEFLLSLPVLSISYSWVSGEKNIYCAVVRCVVSHLMGFEQNCDLTQDV